MMDDATARELGHKIDDLNARVGKLEEAVLLSALADYKALQAVAASRNRPSATADRMRELTDIHDQISVLVQGVPFERVKDE